MKTMKNTPGFTAEASLYRSGRCYLVGGNISGSTAGLVEPQAYTNAACKYYGIPAGYGCAVAGGAAIGLGLGAFGGQAGAGIGGLLGAALGAIWCFFTGCND